MIFQIHLDVLIIPLQLPIDRPPRGSLSGMNYHDHESTSVTMIKNINKVKQNSFEYVKPSRDQETGPRNPSIIPEKSQIKKIRKVPKDVKIIIQVFIINQYFNDTLRNSVDGFNLINAKDVKNKQGIHCLHKTILIPNFFYITVRILINTQATMFQARLEKRYGNKCKTFMPLIKKVLLAYVIYQLTLFQYMEP